MKKEYNKPALYEEYLDINDVILVSKIDGICDWSVETDVTFD